MRSLCALVLFAVVQGGIGSPEYITSKFEERLHPYFPNAKAVLQPEQHGMIGLTCVYGAGPELVKMAGMSFIQELQKNGVMDIVARGFLAAKGYRYIALGFDSGLAVYDLQTKSGRYAPATESYRTGYQRDCGQ